MAGGLLKKWGLGVELLFDAGRATLSMDKVGLKVAEVKGKFKALGGALSGLGGNLASLGAALAPLGIGFGLLVGKGSQLAADLEAQKLTMRVMLGDAAKAEELIAMIRANAAATPFEEGDLIEGSKRLLRLTGSNVTKNMDLLKVMETMAALNPGKSVVDAVEGLLDATSGGGFERLKEFGLSFKAEDFAAAGRPGGEAWADAVSEAIRARMTELTHGEDIVAALSQTFTGRMSTLVDSFKGLAREIGEVFNREIGPMVAPFTDRLMAMGPVVRQAAEQVAGAVRKVVGFLRPMFLQLLGWWDALGTDGQAALLGLVLGLGALSAVLIPVGGAIAAVVFGVVAFVGAIASAWEVIAAFAGVVASVLSPEVLIPVGLALAAVAGAAALVFAVFRKEGEGPLAFIVRLGRAIMGGIVQAFQDMHTRWSAFAGGFGSTFAGFQGLIDQVGPPLRELVARFMELGIFAGGDGVNTDGWALLGSIFGEIANTLVTGITYGLRLAISVIDVLSTTMRPFQVAIVTVMNGLIGLVSGSMGVGDAFKTMARGLLGVITALIAGIYGLILGGVEILIRQVVAMIATLPGMGDFAAKTGTSWADSLASTRQELERAASNSIAGVDLAANARAKEQAAAGSTTVNVAPATVESKITTETTVKVDGNEIARAGGKAAVKSGQRQGAELPAQVRGKVIRGGGTVGVLGPAEVL